MKVILLKNIPKIGKKDEIKEVNDGYAQNFLLPKNLVVVATTSAISELNKRKNQILIEKEIQEDLLIKNLEEIKGKVITIKGKANEKNHLFSAIHKKEILEAMNKEYRISIDESFILLDKPIKELGEFEIPIEINKKRSFLKLIIQKI